MAKIRCQLWWQAAHRPISSGAVVCTHPGTLIRTCQPLPWRTGQAACARLLQCAEQKAVTWGWEGRGREEGRRPHLHARHLGDASLHCLILSQRDRPLPPGVVRRPPAGPVWRVDASACGNTEWKRRPPVARHLCRCTRHRGVGRSLLPTSPTWRWAINSRGRAGPLPWPLFNPKMHPGPR